MKVVFYLFTLFFYTQRDMQRLHSVFAFIPARPTNKLSGFGPLPDLRLKFPETIRTGNMNTIVQRSSMKHENDVNDRTSIDKNQVSRRVKGIGGKKRNISGKGKRNERMDKNKSKNIILDEDEALYSSLSELKSIATKKIEKVDKNSPIESNNTEKNIKLQIDDEQLGKTLEQFKTSKQKENKTSKGKKTAIDFSRFIKVKDISRRRTVLKLEPSDDELLGLMQRFELIDLHYMQSNVTLARIPQQQDINANGGAGISEAAVNAIHIHGVIHAVIDMRCVQSGDIFPYVMATEFNTFIKETKDDSDSMENAANSNHGFGRDKQKQNAPEGIVTLTLTDDKSTNDNNMPDYFPFSSLVNEIKDMSMLDDDIYDDEISSSDVLDVGEIVAQYLYLRLPSYPIKPGIELDLNDDSDGFTIKL